MPSFELPLEGGGTDLMTDPTVLIEIDEALRSVWDKVGVKVEAIGVIAMTVTMPDTRGYQAGDRVRMSGFPNRVRHHIESVVTETVVSVGRFVRPSRGFARHLRRKKGKRT